MGLTAGDDGTEGYLLHFENAEIFPPGVFQRQYSLAFFDPHLGRNAIQLNQRCGINSAWSLKASVKLL